MTYFKYELGDFVLLAPKDASEEIKQTRPIGHIIGRTEFSDGSASYLISYMGVKGDHFRAYLVEEEISPYV